jgi:hypothetical protein
MAVNPDFRELFSALNAAEARYLVVGAYAVIHYTDPRYTKDLDIWVEPCAENAARVLRALRAFGAPVADLTTANLCDPDMVFQIGIEPNRVDILMGLEGLEFSSAWPRAENVTYGGEPIRVLGLDDLLLAKRAAGRPQDRLDVERLEHALRRRR